MAMVKDKLRFMLSVVTNTLQLTKTNNHGRPPWRNRSSTHVGRVEEDRSSSKLEDREFLPPCGGQCGE